ncbi:MAG: hypothetical protein ACOCVL_00175 [Candidatus Sumerlaeota bacterium]
MKKNTGIQAFILVCLRAIRRIAVVRSKKGSDNKSGGIQDKINRMRRQDSVSDEASQRKRDFSAETEDREVESALDAEQFLQEYEKRLRERPFGTRGSEKKRSSVSQKSPKPQNSAAADLQLQPSADQKTPASRGGNGSAKSASTSKKPHRRFKGSVIGIKPPAEGAILWLETGEIALLDRVSKQSESQLVVVLLPGGEIDIRPVNLRETAFEKLGRMPEDDLVNIHIAKSWYRAHILFHLDKFEDAPLIPRGAGTPGQESKTSTRSADWPEHSEELYSTTTLPKKDDPSNAIKGKTPFRLKRGQRFTIDFGENRAWDAIYWGGDGTGSLVVHNTHDEWALTRLDFKRFPKENVHPGEMLSEREIWEIEEYLKRMYTD